MVAKQPPTCRRNFQSTNSHSVFIPYTYLERRRKKTKNESNKIATVVHRIRTLIRYFSFQSLPTTIIYIQMRVVSYNFHRSV